LPLLFHFNLPNSTNIYSLSLHDALPIYIVTRFEIGKESPIGRKVYQTFKLQAREITSQAIINYPQNYKNVSIQCFFSSVKTNIRSEEHTSELQSRFDLVCRLLLETRKYI